MYKEILMKDESCLDSGMLVQHKWQGDLQRGAAVSFDNALSKQKASEIQRLPASPLQLKAMPHQSCYCTDEELI